MSPKENSRMMVAKAGAISASAATTCSPPSPSISASARLPRSSRLEAVFGTFCIIVVHPLFDVGIAGDHGDEDEKKGLQLGDVSADKVTVAFQHFPPLRIRAALHATLRLAEHVADRQTGVFEATDELDPREERRIVVAPPRSVPDSVRNQPDTFVVA